MHAILDSRVVYALNWLLLKTGSERYLPDVKGRNTLMELLDYRSLLLTSQTHDLSVQITKEISEAGNKSRLSSELNNRIRPPQGSYKWYLDLMHLISSTVFPEDAFRLMKTEMLLFAGATTFVAKEAAMTLLPTWISAAEELRRTGCPDMGHAPTR